MAAAPCSAPDTTEERWDREILAHLADEFRRYVECRDSGDPRGAEAALAELMGWREHPSAILQALALRFARDEETMLGLEAMRLARQFTKLPPKTRSRHDPPSLRAQTKVRTRRPIKAPAPRERRNTCNTPGRRSRHRVATSTARGDPDGEADPADPDPGSSWAPNRDHELEAAGVAR